MLCGTLQRLLRLLQTVVRQPGLTHAQVQRGVVGCQPPSLAEGRQCRLDTTGFQGQPALVIRPAVVLGLQRAGIGPGHVGSTGNRETLIQSRQTGIGLGLFCGGRRLAQQLPPHLQDGLAPQGGDTGQVGIRDGLQLDGWGS
jgi:hypothetical protein